MKLHIVPVIFLHDGVPFPPEVQNLLNHPEPRRLCVNTLPLAEPMVGNRRFRRAQRSKKAQRG